MDVWMEESRKCWVVRDMEEFVIVFDSSEAPYFHEQGNWFGSGQLAISTTGRWRQIFGATPEVNKPMSVQLPETILAMLIKEDEELTPSSEQVDEMLALVRGACDIIG